MMEKPKWITFRPRGIRHDHDAWYVMAVKDGAILGFIEWYPKWRRFVFLPDYRPSVFVFEQDCLRDIANFIEENTRLVKARKVEMKKILAEI